MQTKKWAIKVAILCLCLGVASTCPAKVIHVDGDAAGANDGSSWADAYNYLQDALADANASPKPVEIRVAHSIYRPDEDMLHPDGTGDREATFRLIDGVTLKGGYAGFGEPNPNAWDVELYKTILSGDLNGNDVEVPDPCDLLHGASRADNSYHILTGSETDGTAILDGFTIRGGNADGPWNIYGGPDDGGGMLNSGGSPFVLNCVFIENSAQAGGGMYNIYSNPTLTNCIFSRNWAGVGAGMNNFYLSSATLTDCTFKDNSSDLGGGIADLVGSVLINCTFTGNSSADSGGAIFSYGAPFLIGCTFIRNCAGYGGGAIYAYDAPIATIRNCVFEKNSAQWGGAIYNWEAGVDLINCLLARNVATHGGGISDSDSFSVLIGCTFVENLAFESGGGAWSERSRLILTNCSLIGNSAAKGNALACDSMVQDSRMGKNPSSFHIIANCILWDGNNEIWNNRDSAITVSYSDTKGGQASIYDPCNAVVWGEGNIDADPCFAGPGYWEDPCNTPTYRWDDAWVAGDYHLKSQAGRWDASEGRWMTDDVTSPCIDAGDPMSPIGLEPFPNGGIVNMGAYGGTAEASKSYFGKPLCETIMAGDINGDCEVNFLDFRLVALHWLEEH